MMAGMKQGNHEMRDILSIATACREEEISGRTVVLATVVKVEGSAYRRPGARMLVRSDGSRIGSISGGCLEADTAEHALRAMETGEPQLLCYNGRSSFDPVAETGCKGAIYILIEPVTPELLCSLDFMTSFISARGAGAVATVFRVKGKSQICVGDRIMQREQGSIQGSIIDSRVILALMPALAEARVNGKPLVKTITIKEAGVEIEAMVEPALSPIALAICGAGQDAIPLAKMAGMLGWQVTILDHRDSLLSSLRFPGAHALLPQPGKQSLMLDSRTAVVLMTHNYEQDWRWLQFALASPVKYIGVLGPRKRMDQLRSDWWEEGLALGESDMKRIHSPIGLDLGAETSEEIALSILAEIQSVFHDRCAYPLRDGHGAIHSN